MIRRLALVLAMGALLGALLPGIATATQSDTVASCKDGGWEQLVREDGSTFKNQGACVSYAAQGGTPVAPDPLRTICEALPAGEYTRTSDGVYDVVSACDTNDLGLRDSFYNYQWLPACRAQPAASYTASLAGFYVYCYLAF